jgi:Polysaccharide lyase
MNDPKKDQTFLSRRCSRALVVLLALSGGGIAAASSPAAAAPLAYPVPVGSVLVSNFSFTNAVVSSRLIYVSQDWTVFQGAPGRWRTGHADPTPVGGKKWGRFEVVPKDPQVAHGPRAEVSFSRAINDGTVIQSCGRWYIPSYSDLPDPFNSWQILYEEHPTGSAMNPLYAHPPEALWVMGTMGRPYSLRLASGTGLRTDWESRHGAFLPNTWHSFCVRALWSPLRSGWVELWIDGRWQTLDDGQRRKYQVTMPSPGHYTMDGIYDGGGSENRQHSVTFMDDLQIWRLVDPTRARPPVRRSSKPSTGMLRTLFRALGLLRSLLESGG